MKLHDVLFGAAVVLGSASIVSAQVGGVGTCYLTEASENDCGTDSEGDDIRCCGVWVGPEYIVTAQAVRNCQPVSYSQFGEDDCEPTGGSVYSTRQDYKCGGPQGCDWVPDGAPYNFHGPCPSAILNGEACDPV